MFFLIRLNWILIIRLPRLLHHLLFGRRHVRRDSSTDEPIGRRRRGAQRGHQTDDEHLQTDPAGRRRHLHDHDAAARHLLGIPRVLSLRLPDRTGGQQLPARYYYDITVVVWTDSFIANCFKFNIGMTITFASIIGIPFLYVSDVIVRKIGSVNVIVLAFLAYCIRFFGYSFIWWILMIYCYLSYIYWRIRVWREFCHTTGIRGWVFRLKL